MYFDASESLLNEAPDLHTQIEAVDQFFEKRLKFSDVLAPATEIAKKSEIDVDDAHRILHGLVERGVVTRLFVPVCMQCRDNVGIFESFDAIPDTFTCDECPGEHKKDKDNVFLMYRATMEDSTPHPTQGRGAPSAPDKSANAVGNGPRTDLKGVLSSLAAPLSEDDSVSKVCDQLDIQIEHLHLGNRSHDDSVHVGGQSRYDGGTRQDIHSGGGQVDASRAETSTSVTADNQSEVQLGQGDGGNGESSWKWKLTLLVTLFLGVAGLFVQIYVAEVENAPEPTNERESDEQQEGGADVGEERDTAPVSRSGDTGPQ